MCVFYETFLSILNSRYLGGTFLMISYTRSFTFSPYHLRDSNLDKLSIPSCLSLSILLNGSGEPFPLSVGPLTRVYPEEGFRYESG